MKTPENLILVDIDDLVPYARNARTHSAEQISKLRASIREFGFINPCIIDRDNNIIAGHGRVLAARAEKINPIPCVLVDHLSDAQKRAYILADNRMAEMAGWDDELLKLELGDLSDFGFDLALTGFDADFLLEDSDVGDVAEAEFDFDAKIEPRAKRGDIFVLGSHRLMCGDAFSPDDVSALLVGGGVDMVFTDPPYDMEMDGSGAFAASMANCKRRVSPLTGFDPYSIQWMAAADYPSIYIFSSKNGISKYLDIFSAYNYDILFWGKTNPVPHTHGYFLPDVEYILYFSRKGRIWNNSLSPTSVYKKYYITPKLEGRKDAGGDIHPTIKPLQIASDKIRISSNKNGIVFDPFGGSGTTMIAAEQLGRSCRMMELEPKYVDVIIARWEAFTGRKAELLSNGPPS